jgi:membrane dipeptidase
MLGGPFVRLGRCRPAADSAVEVSTRAIDAVLGTTVIDMLGFLTLDWPTLYGWQRDASLFGETEFRELESSGVNVVHPAVAATDRDAHAGARRWIAGWRAMLRGRACYLAMVETVADLSSVPGAGKIGVVIGLQDSTHFRTSADVDAFQRMGQRVSQLTYNDRNALGSGCFVFRDRGLTPFGAEIVSAMNRVGMAIDVSHCGERTTLDAIAASRTPVLVTHANCRALVPKQRRCKSDTVIEALAKRGGVMGIAMLGEWVARRSPSIEDYLDHFDHVRALCGPEHVGLGSDADVTTIRADTGQRRRAYRVEGLDPRFRVFQLADGLLRRGWAPADVELVLGGNWRRVLGLVWPPGAPPAPALEARRDPFCPAPLRVAPAVRPE